MLELTQGIRRLAEHPRTIAREVLLQHLGQQRWFGGKARQAVDACLIKPIYWEAADVVHTLIEVRYDDGGQERYYFPLVFRPDGDAFQAAANSVLVPATGPGGPGVVCDAAGDPRFVVQLYACIAQGGGCAGAESAICGLPLRPLEADFSPTAVQQLGGEHSHTLWRLGSAFLLKILRRLVDGPHPDVEIGRFLLKHEGRRTPPLAGFIEYRVAGREPATLAVLHDWVEHHCDGWTQALRELAGFYQRVREQRLAAAWLPQLDGDAAQAAESFPPPRELIGSYLETARDLGFATADLHGALAASQRDAAFAPAPLTEEDLETTAASIRERFERICAALRRQLPQLPQAARPPAECMLERAYLPPRLNPALDPAERLVRIRVHGDYHLGQVLLTPRGFVVVDFEGEPARPLAERRAKYTPLRDVAGMVRSFSYAAYAGLRTFLAAEPQARSQVSPWAAVWQAWTSAAFLQEYRAQTPATFVPRDTQRFQAMLNLYLLDKALYELDYEMNNRPDWVEIPLRALCGLLGGAYH